MTSEKIAPSGEAIKIEHLFGSVTRTRLLRTFLNNHDKAFFVRELSRTIGLQLNAVRRELDNLANLGIVQSIDDGQKKFYRLNQENILFPELKALILKSQLFIEQNIMHTIDSLGEARLLLLTGKFVHRGELAVDMFIVGHLDRDLLRKFVGELQIELGFELNYTVMTEKEYAYRLEVGDKFLYSIVEAKRITLIDRREKE